VKYAVLAVAVLVLVPAGAHGSRARDPDEHTVLLMHFDGDLTDASGQTAGGTAEGSVSYVSGISGQAIRVENDDASDQSRVFVPDTDALDLEGSFTVELWFKLLDRSGSHNTAGRIVTKALDDPFWVSNYYLHVWTSNVLLGGFFYDQGAGVAEVVMGDAGEPVVTLDTWYHVGLIYNDTTATLTLFVHDDSGQPTVVFQQSAQAGGNPSSNEDELNIGCGGLAAPDGWFDGVIDELVISDVARRVEDIAPDLPPVPPAGFTVAALDTQSALLEWLPNPEPDIAHYNVYRSTTQGFAPTAGDLVASPTDTFYLDAGLSSDVYYYRVSAVDTAGQEGGFSQEGSAILLAPPAPILMARYSTMELHLPQPAEHLDLIAGFDVFRCKDGDGYPETPTAPVDLDSIWSDDGLEPGTTYRYKLAYRTRNLSRGLDGPDAPATTTVSPTDYVGTMSIEVLLVIFRNTSQGYLSDTDIGRLKQEVAYSERFYWRNSLGTCNLDVSYLVIPDYVDLNLTDLGSTNVVQQYLRAYGVADLQYDGIFEAGPGCPGTWSWGVVAWPFMGPEHSTGFSTSFYPLYAFDYPANDPGLNYGMTWIFTHEFQHQVDAMYDLSGYPEMGHGDAPLDYAFQAGEHFSYQAEMYRLFPYWLDLGSYFGRYLESEDADGDGMADADVRLAVDESRFGSSSGAADTDGDGLFDLCEAYAGIYGGSDPDNQDTDGDGVADDSDRYPLYPVSTTVRSRPITVDGFVDPTEWDAAQDGLHFTRDPAFDAQLYADWSDTLLYLGLVETSGSIIELFLDATNDGWWNGRDNYHLRIDPTHGTIYARVMDTTDEARAYNQAHGGYYGEMWDDDPRYVDFYGHRLVENSDFPLGVGTHSGEVHVEVGIPRNLDTEFMAEPGDTLGLRVYYSDIWASAFENFEFVDFDLALLSISGTIRDGTTNLPVAGAQAHYSGPQTGTATSDAWGRYGICSLPAGSYTLWASSQGYDDSPTVVIDLPVEGQEIANLYLLPPGFAGPVFFFDSVATGPDGVVAAQENELCVYLRNTGNEAVQGLTGALRSLDSWVAVTDSACSYGPTEPWEQAVPLNAVRVLVDAACPHGHVATLEIEASNGSGHTWADTFSVSITGVPIVSVLETGHDFGQVPQGGSATWDLGLTNVGGMPLNLSRVVVRGGNSSLYARGTDKAREDAGVGWIQPHVTCDGSSSTRWFTSPANAVGNYIKFDFETPLTVARVEIDPSDYDPANSYVRGYEIAASLDGEQWVVLASDSANAEQYVVATFDPVLCRYVKLTVTATDGVHFTTIGEILTYGTPDEVSPYHPGTTWNVEVAPDDTSWVTVTFEPQTSGVIMDTLLVLTDDPVTPAVAVPVSGEGLLEAAGPDLAPGSLALRPPRPNPTGSSAAVRLELPTSCRVSLALYDVAGRLAQTLYEGWQPAGYHTVQWTPRVAPGLYLMRLAADGESRSRRVVVR
jgi:hypothetical protein